MATGPFLMTGKHGTEAVVPWLMIGAMLGGLLSRSLIGAIVGAALVYFGWFLVIRSFGGQCAARLGAVEAGEKLPARRR